MHSLVEILFVFSLKHMVFERKRKKRGKTQIQGSLIKFLGLISHPIHKRRFFISMRINYHSKTHCFCTILSEVGILFDLLIGKDKNLTILIIATTLSVGFRCGCLTSNIAIDVIQENTGSPNGENLCPDAIY